MLGACIGDAAGSVLEKLGRKPTLQEVKMAMALLGGGAFQLAPGQVTDDGELTICTARGLIDCGKQFDLEKVAHSYADWVLSPPFDMGVTIGGSMGIVLMGERNHVFKEQALNVVGYAKAMRYAAQSGEAKLSKSNGSLMRSCPIGIYCHKLPIEQVAYIAGLICGLSHPNPTVIYAVQSYCIAIARLVDGVKPLEAFNITKEWLKTKAQDPGAQEVLQWLNEAEEFANDAAIGKRELSVLEHLHVPYHPGSGFVRVGYYHAFKHLLMGTPIYGAIAEVLSGGGDTDTNACIVGGLIGAAFGTENIPEALKNPVLRCDPARGSKHRPDFLYTKHLPDLVDKLLAVVPDAVETTPYEDIRGFPKIDFTKTLAK
jgi:ADP-ribosylglycohydrolase